MEQESSTTVAADPIVWYMSRAQLEKRMSAPKLMQEVSGYKTDFIEAAQYRDEVLKMEELLKENGIEAKKPVCIKLFDAAFVTLCI